MDANWAKAFLERLCAELAAGRAAASEPGRRGPWTKAKAILPAAGLALGLTACSGAAAQVQAPSEEPAAQVAPVDEPPVEAYGVPLSPEDEEPVDVYGAPDDLDEPPRDEVVPLYAAPAPDELEGDVSNPIPPESYALYEAPSEPEGLAPADPGSVAVPAYAAPTPELISPGGVVALYAAPVPDAVLELSPDIEEAE
jgi:hypothetical protein